MGLFSYREKRYGKFTFVLIALIIIALAGGAIYGGIYAVLNMEHWAKYVIIVVASIVGLLLAILGIFLILFSFSLIGSSKSVRDGNKAKGIANTRLCDKCGRVITKKSGILRTLWCQTTDGIGSKNLS